MADEYVDALCREIRSRHHEAVGTERTEACHTAVTTIYFGGGTPSLLTTGQRQRILECIYDNYDVAPDAEVTLEANPDDAIDTRGFNRVSLGIQTFDDGLLRTLRRRHDAQTAIRAVQQLKADGITNISIDLIYGLPGQTMAMWAHDLSTAFSLGVQHLSAYALSYEAGTVLSRLRDEGRLNEVSEELCVAMYERLCLQAEDNGFEHYEISNFARPDHASRHNSSYWTGEPYLGFGPGAHSFDGMTLRRANRPDLQSYLLAYSNTNGTPRLEDVATQELLTDSELYNEAVMCGLRTSHGINLVEMERRFGSLRTASLLRMAERHIQAGRLKHEENRLHLTQSALMTSDDIMSDLMADK